MASILGALGLNSTDSSLAFSQVVGQKTIFDAVNTSLGQHEMDIAASIGVFVENTTSDHIERYFLPGGGRLQRLSENSRPALMKVAGNWDVAYPLEEFGSGIGKNRVGYAYMTLQDLDRDYKAIEEANIATIRNEILYALLHGSTRPFKDPFRGNLTIQPLATASDGIVYPPVIGSETEATKDAYITSGYVASAISNVNDPFPVLVNGLEQHWGTPTGGSKIVVFINNAQTSIVQTLAEYSTVTNMFIRPGDDISTVMDIPEGLPGRTLGVHQSSNAVIQEWRWLPAGYMLALHMMAPKPLKRRVDPGYTGLSSGLKLIATSDVNPYTESMFSNRFGFGVGNRIGAMVMQFAVAGPYTPPATFA